MKHKLLVVDDDLIVLELIQKSLANENLELILTDNPNTALKLFLENPCLVVLFDLNMPGMSGEELIQKIFESGYNPITIVLTAETDVRKATELFKKGIHDYLVKPINFADLINRVGKAFEFAELRKIKENIQKEREIRIEHQLNWNLYKESLIKKDFEKEDKSLITSIHNSLIQGGGLGTLNFLIEMIEESSQIENEKYSTDKELMQTLFESARSSKKLINIIGEIEHVINSEILKEKKSITEVYTIIQEVVNDLQKFQEIKENLIVLAKNSYNNFPKYVNINSEYFRKAITELILNALKFSADRSKVYILFEIVKDQYEISVLNSPERNTKIQDGIPSEYQNIIFEPFFRISQFAYEKFPTQDFGLGLSLVEKIIRNHGGTIRVLNLKNYLEDTSDILIDFIIQFPLLKE